MTQERTSLITALALVLTVAGPGPALAGPLSGAGTLSMGLSTLHRVQALRSDAPASDQLAEVLQIERLIAVLAAEGRAQGADLGAEMFDPISAARWRASVAAVHDPERMRATFLAAFDAAILWKPDDIAAIAAFFGRAEGARLLDLEMSARTALIDPAASDAASVAWQRIVAQDPARSAALNRFVQVNDLIEANVAGGMNANLAFLRGLGEAGGGVGARDEQGLLADIWSQEEVIRAETSDWLLPYLALAYRPLATTELEAYSDFCASPAGQALNRAMLTAFDALFVQISTELGRAAGRSMSGSDL